MKPPAAVTVVTPKEYYFEQGLVDYLNNNRNEQLITSLY